MAASSSHKFVLLMHMTRETIDSNKSLLAKLGDDQEGSAIGVIREKTVQWLLNVSMVARISPETRDSAVQILDAFLAQLDATVISDPLKDNSAFFIGLAAAAAIILASKIHEIRPLCVTNFPHFEREQLLEFERRLLLMIGFRITPQATPSACVRSMLGMWGGRVGAARTSDEVILAAADALVAAFWKDLASLRFAPSTIALSALLLTFSRFRMDCSDWLQTLPDECFPPPGPGDHAFLARDELAFLNVDQCLSAMQRVQQTRAADAAAAVAAAVAGGGCLDTEKRENQRLTPTSTAVELP